ncbi:MAG: hypothetical protein HY289_13895 [Planctomycetes bacterium]|nr:hypothetical protein [Planctomycetota bacterium]
MVLPWHLVRAVGAVGMNAPDAPIEIGAKTLIFQGTEHDAPILESYRTQGARNVEVADHFHVAAVAIHDKQLEGNVESHVIAARHLEAIAIAGEHYLAARQGEPSSATSRLRNPDGAKACASRATSGHSSRGAAC